MRNENAGVYADAELAAAMSDQGSMPPPPRVVGVAAARAANRARTAGRPPGPELAAVENFTVEGVEPIPVRFYRPTDEQLPTIVYFHGGGWTAGDLDSHDRVCRRFAKEGTVAVLAVDYRLAPENRWPAAVEDCVAVTRFALANYGDLGGAAGVSVAGDSAGGNLAALVALECRDALVAQILVYPQTDLTFSHQSHVEKGTGFGLTSDSALFFAEQWVPEKAERSRPEISPVFASDFTGVAPALVVVAEHDPLRDEGVAYARLLITAGVDTTLRIEPGLVHGFLSHDTISPAARAAGERIFQDGARLAKGERISD